MGPQFAVVSREDPRTAFEATLDRAFTANEQSGVGPTHIRSLAKEMVRLQHGVDEDVAMKRVEHWRRSLRRYMSGDRGYTEETRELIAKALRVETSALPPPRPRAGWRQRAEELERERQELLRRLARRRSSS